MFDDNCDPLTNGETRFFLNIKDAIQTIFDIGCKNNSSYTSFEGEVHYFDPMASFIETLSKQPNCNKKSFFNRFGLGNENKELFYYTRYESFCDRKITFGENSSEKILLKIRKGSDYIKETNIQLIDFIKIDTEGYELEVLRGFEEHLRNVKIIQFEYGGTYLDKNIKLLDVVRYLQSFGFDKFSYLTSHGVVPITDFNDHYRYCNIVCLNKNTDIIPSDFVFDSAR